MPRAKKPTKQSPDVYVADRHLPSQVRVLVMPTNIETYELRWKDPATGLPDSHRLKMDKLAAAAEAEQLATRIREGVDPHLGRAVKTRQRAAQEPAPAPRREFRTLKDVEVAWAKQFDKKPQSLKSALYNLEHYVYPMINEVDAFGKPTGGTICLEKMAITDIDEGTVKVWSRSLGYTKSNKNKPYSSSTRALALRNLNALLNFAVKKKKWLTENPAEDVKVDLYDVKKKDSFESQEQFLRVVSFLPDWAKAPVIVLAYTGVRFGEGAAFAIAAVDLTKNRIWVERTLTTEGVLSTPKSTSSQDSVPFHPSLAPVLETHIASLPSRALTAPLFQGQRGGKRLHNRSLNTVLKNACEAAGLDIRVTCHGLRRSLASWLSANGVPTIVIQRILRHADPRTTASYIDTRESEAADAMLTLPPLPEGLL